MHPKKNKQTKKDGGQREKIKLQKTTRIRVEKGQTKINMGWHKDRKKNPNNAPSIHIGALVGASSLWPLLSLCLQLGRCLPLNYYNVKIFALVCITKASCFSFLCTVDTSSSSCVEDNFFYAKDNFFLVTPFFCCTEDVVLWFSWFLVFGFF
jgi:hypothetical protein